MRITNEIMLAIRKKHLDEFKYYGKYDPINDVWELTPEEYKEVNHRMTEISMERMCYCG